MTTLSANGNFTHLQIFGDIPSPRIRAEAWSYKHSIFIFGGFVKEIDVARKKNFAFGRWNYYTNETFCFNTSTNNFVRLETTGKRPSPRYGSAVAQIDHLVYIHGGLGNCYIGDQHCQFTDFYTLDLKIFKWREIRESGMSNGLGFHSLTPVSSSQLLLVGGIDVKDKIYSRIAMFDIIKSEWKERERLPVHFSGFEGGLDKHRAFQFQNERGLSIICIGGYINDNSKLREHSYHMVIFDFPAQNTTSNELQTIN